jgi:hypothetical protein
MKESLVKQVRLEQTAQMLDLVHAEVAAWVADRRRKDQVQQYHTQLNALETALSDCLRELRREFGTIGSGRSDGEVFQACRAFEGRATLLRRLSAYFERRFAQRDDPSLGPVLAAADEVVWSCYVEAFHNADAGAAPRGTTPLPCIELELSPAAVVRDSPPGELRHEGTDELLGRHLAMLPVPVVRLPATIVHAPWWLVYLGHEVGHHLQHDLVPEWGLVGAFNALLARTAGADGARWRPWGEEVFADICSVLAVGPWAVWAMVELELANDQAMLATDRPSYPPPAVRLALLAAVAGRLGLDGRAALRGVDPAGVVHAPLGVSGRCGVESGGGTDAQRVGRDLELVPVVAEVALETALPGVGMLARLYDQDPSDYKPRGRIDEWADQLLGEEPRFPEPGLRTGRELAAAGVAAYARATRLDDPEKRAKALGALRDGLLDLIVASRPLGTRAAETAAEPDVAGLGAKLAAAMIADVPEEAA